MQLRVVLSALVGVITAVGGGALSAVSSSQGVSTREVSALARAGCASGSATRDASSAASPSIHHGLGSGPSAAAWSGATVLVPGTVPTGSLALAATAAGSVAAGWVQGPPPRVVVDTAVRRSATVLPSGQQKVMFAGGSLRRGFRKPVQLSSGPSGSFSGLQIAVSAPDVAYAVWAQSPGTTVRLTVMRGTHLAVARKALIHDAVPLALFPLVGGCAALVWDQYGSGTPFVEYAILSSTGRLGRIARIAHPGTRDTAAAELSVNAHGELVASWVRDDLQPVPGSAPASGRYLTAQLVVAICRPALHCARSQTVSLGGTEPVCIVPAVAISPNGTATVIAAAQAFGPIGCENPIGVWASHTPENTRTLQPMRLINSAGANPVALPAGNGGTIIAFNPGHIPWDSLASSWLPARPVGRPPGVTLDHGGQWNNGAQVAQLSATPNGWYAIAWTHANRRSNPQLSVLATIGHNRHLESVTTAADTSAYPSQYVTAIDNRGDAMLLYNASTDRGDGAAWPYSKGIDVALYRR